jgi:hypothetical protein
MHSTHMVGYHSSNSSMKPSLRFQAEQSDIIKLKGSRRTAYNSSRPLFTLVSKTQDQLGVMGHHSVQAWHGAILELYSLRQLLFLCK